MSFLHALYLAGLSAVALPIVFHMIRRTPKGQVAFSTTMFLDPSPPRVTRRTRLDNWPLLLLRVLTLVLLAAAFARPFLRETLDADPEAGGSLHVVLLDTSASMQREDLWQRAVEAALARVRQAEPDDRIAVAAFDRQVRDVITFDEWLELEAPTRSDVVASRLHELKPGWAHTDLGQALVFAAESLAAATATAGGQGSSEQRITVISDLQSGIRLEALQAFEWPDEIVAQFETLFVDNPGNAGLQLLQNGPDEDTAVTRVRIANSQDSRREQFEVVRIDADGQPLGPPRSVHVAAGRSRTVRLPPATTAGPGQQIRLLGDKQEFDNTVHLHNTAAEQMQVRYLADDDATDPESLWFYLARAFPPTRLRQVEVAALQTPVEPALRDPELRVVVAAGPIDPPQSTALDTWTAAGGTLVYVVERIDSLPTLERLLQITPLDLAEAEPDDYAMLTDIDYEHRLFAPFDDPRFADFTQIHIWNYRRLSSPLPDGLRVLARFDNEAPAMVERRTGAGRILVLLTGWNPVDSQLALSTRFVPLLNTLLDLNTAPIAQPSRYEVGDEVSLVAGVQQAATKQSTVIAPDATRIRLASLETPFRKTDTPGTYVVSSPAGDRRFAVNLAESESRTEPLSTAQLRQFGITPAESRTAQTPEDVAATQRHLRAQELESRQKFWQWLLALTVIVVLLETGLAGWLAHKPTVAG